ncbi:MAG: hypothetical protein A2Z18_09230 [Armatimonadetes bacterium RBG_16_58_9]|nr:MAG: hypothetical protein A2Z18_09230 [Armatimonadetes bacterium RBG_16_58_9]
MYAKLLKIVALGVGAVVTTGVPSGNISVGPSTRVEIQVREPYKLKQKDKPWEEENSLVVKWNGTCQVPTIDCGPGGNQYGFLELQKPMEFQPASASSEEPKQAKEVSEVSKPILIPGTRIVLVSQSPVFERDAPIGHMAQQAEYGPGVCYSGTLFQPPTSRVARLRSYTHQWWQQNTQDDLDLEDIFVKGLAGNKYPDDKAADSSVNPPRSVAVEPVSEPAGLLAIAAGLPGLAILRRRRRNPITSGEGGGFCPQWADEW